MSRKATILLGALSAVLMSTGYLVTDAFYRSTHVGSSDSPWLWFWVFGVCISLLLIYSGLFPRSCSTALRKRVMVVLSLVLTTLMLTAYAHYRSTFFGRTHWALFWEYEVFLGAWFIYAVVKVFREAPK